jgi:hypothetical protein
MTERILAWRSKRQRTEFTPAALVACSHSLGSVVCITDMSERRSSRQGSCAIGSDGTRLAKLANALLFSTGKHAHSHETRQNSKPVDLLFNRLTFNDGNNFEVGILANDRKGLRAPSCLSSIPGPGFWPYITPPCAYAWEWLGISHAVPFFYNFRVADNMLGIIQR